MKNKTILLLGISLIAGLLLTGCGQSAKNGTGEDQSSTSGAGTNKEIAEDAQNSDEQTTASTGEKEIELPSEALLKNMFNQLNTWAGMQYMVEPTQNYSELSNDIAIEMASYAIASTSEEIGFDENGYGVIEKYKVDEKMQNMFGKTFNIERYKHEFYSPLFTRPGEVLLQIGDWGLVSPEYEITSVVGNDDGTFNVSLRYFAMDLEEQCEYMRYGYVVNYKCALSDSSKYGFIILDMNAIRTGDDPAPFDPSTAAGNYSQLVAEETEGNLTYYTYWVVLNEDGTGELINQDDKEITFNSRYIFAGDERIPYNIIGEKITLYRGDDYIEDTYIATYNSPYADEEETK